MENWIIGQHNTKDVTGFIEERCSKGKDRFLVCFDYFDTIVTRSVIPEQTKVLASSSLCHRFGLEISGQELYEIRRDLELEMTAANVKQFGESDFRLDDFAVQLWSLLQQRGYLQRVDQQLFVSSQLDIEVAVEGSVQKVCPEVEEVISSLFDLGVELVLVSDFYLPVEPFKRMVAATGMAKYFSEVYISSSCGKSKGSGSLYSEILHSLQVNPQNMVMIGDNEHADIKMAREQGIATIHLQRPSQEMTYSELQERQESTELKNVAEIFSDALLPDCCFAEMGISLWHFTHRLFESLQAKGVADVFFLSKEGELLKRLFDEYQQQLFGVKPIRSHYLVASRKATFIASLRPLAEEDFGRLLSHYRDISIREFLLSLNLEENNVSRIIDQLVFDCDVRLTDTANHPNFHALLELPTFQHEYERRRVEQSCNFIHYLNSFGLDLQNVGLHLVDVGWKGSIQDNIYHILRGQIVVEGCFLGSFNPTELRDSNRKHGLLFENQGQESPFFKVYNNNRSLFEMMLGASNGSADSYLLEEALSVLSPASEKSVFEARTCAEGQLHVMVRDYPQERKLYDDLIAPLQQSFLDCFCSITLKFLVAGCIAPHREWFARQHARMVFLPTREEIELYERMEHLENFGIFEYTGFDSSHNFSCFERLKNLKNIVFDPAILESGVWPPIILRRFGVGFWQPIDGRIRFRRAF